MLIAAAIPFSLRQSDHLSAGGFDAPGSQSIQVTRALADGEFPGARRASLAAVVVPERGATAAQVDAALGRVSAAAAKVEDVELAPAALAQARKRAKAGVLVVPLSVDTTEDKAINVARDLRKELDIAAGAQNGVTLHLAGQGALWSGMQVRSKEDLAKAEQAGFPIVALILLGVFGSLVAASLPLILGVVSVFVTGALIYFTSRAMDMSVFVTNMASMIGIGVAVDYSLFVLARYREEIYGGHDPGAARARAMATSGLAVLFSGLTVIVSLAGLWMIPSNAVRSMALGAILVVAVSLLATATLLPVLIRSFGHRAYRRSRFFLALPLILRSRAPRRPGSTRATAARPPFWDRWTARVTRRPVVAAIASASLLLVLAIPVLDLQTGAGALRQFPKGDETRQGIEAAASVTPPGAAAPVNVVVRGNDAAVARVRTALAADANILSVAPGLTARDGHATLLAATPRTDGESPVAKEMVARLRATLPAAAGPGAGVEVGGTTAAQVDITHMISSSMWKVLLFVLGLSYIVLLVLLRSAVLPLKAVVMNLLSVGAAFGVLVAVFEWGWLDGFLGFQSSGHIDTLTPPLVLAVVFGLSMDYEVFLLARIRERYEKTGDNRAAVAQGLASSARTITSAALIMASVFMVFVGTGLPSIKELGLGCAVAILIDATIVRLILVPATMELLGKWNWWLPRPLARVLPKGSFEELPSPAPHAA